MVHLAPTIALAVLASCISTLAVPFVNERSNPTTLPMTYYVKKGVSTSDIVQADKMRARSVVQTRGTMANSPITNTVTFYTVPVQVGTQTFNLIVDTGSSTTWVGANTTTYHGGPAAVNTGSGFFVLYGSGDVFGIMINDTVTLAGLQILNMPIGNSTLHNGIFGGTDGIAGFGPQGLTWNVATQPLDQGFPTLLTELAAQRGVANVLGVYFKPEAGSDNKDMNGELTIGGVDSSKYSGKLTYAPLATAPIYNKNWAINVSSISTGSTSLMNTSHPAMVDTGTTFTYIPQDAYYAFLEATGGIDDPDLEVPYWTTPPKASITLTIGGTPFTLTPSQYLIPAAQVNDLNIGLNTTVSWGYILNGGPEIDGFVSFILGQKFLENFYSVYDTDKSRIGFAPRK